MRKMALFLLITSFMLVGCSRQEILIKLHLEEEEVEETTETEPVILAPEFLASAVDKYKDEIGQTVAGSRIVERRDTADTVEFSIYKFDETGFTHGYYYFAFDDGKFLSNQTDRLQELDYVEDSLMVDNTCNLVKFDLEYVTVGNNAYNYFRDMLIKNEEEQLAELYGKVPDVLPESIAYPEYTYSIVGNMDEYVPELPELEEDEEGYVLCDNSDPSWSYISDGNGGIILTAYQNQQYGNKLVIPAYVDGKAVYAVRHLEPISGVTCVEVSEGINELQGSFTDWPDLNRLIVHDGLVSITQGAIQGTNITSIDLPKSIVNLEDGFFSMFDVGVVSEFDYDITRITGFYQGSNIVSIIIPSTVSVIDTGAFDKCNQLATVFIEDGCTTIAEGAFKGAPNLQAVAIPSSVTNIGADAFNKNTLLVVEEDSYAIAYAKLYDLVYTIQ